MQWLIAYGTELLLYAGAVVSAIVVCKGLVVEAVVVCTVVGSDAVVVRSVVRIDLVVTFCVVLTRIIVSIFPQSYIKLSPFLGTSGSVAKFCITTVFKNGELPSLEASLREYWVVLIFTWFR